MSDERWTLCANMRRGCEGAPIVRDGPRIDFYDHITVVPERRALDAEAEIERLTERNASLMLAEPSKTQGLYAAIDELQRVNEALREALLATRCITPTWCSTATPCSRCEALSAVHPETEAPDA